MLGGVGQTMGLLYLKVMPSGRTIAKDQAILRHAANVRIEIQGTQLILGSMATNRVRSTHPRLPYSPPFTQAEEVSTRGLGERETWGTVGGVGDK